MNHDQDIMDPNQSINWLELTIPQFLEKVSEINPNGIAIETAETKITYDQLNRMSNDLAFKILAQIPRTDYVAIISSEFIQSIVAQFAILKAGKAAAILVTNWPATMLSQTIEQLGCELILTDEENEEKVQFVLESINTEFKIHTIGKMGQSAENPTIVVDTSAPAYVLFTSGSTNLPKGVIKSHQFIMHDLLIRAEKYQMTNADRVMITNDLFFGRTLFTTLSTFFGRTTLVLKELKKEGIHTLPRWLIEQNITIFSPTGSMLRAFNAILDGTERFTSLRIVRVGAEAVYESDLSNLRQCISDQCLIWVNYGSTETGSICCNIFTREVKFDSPVLPVGRPFRNKSLRILDEFGTDVEHGETGQIIIASNYMSSGYINHKNVNQNNFATNRDSGTTIYYTGDLGKIRSDGHLEIKGRKDQMVKIRGYRVDLAFIEMQLNKLADVNICAVTVNEHNGVRQIVAHFVMGKKGTLSKLKASIINVLPDYMRPSQLNVMKALPRLANGKIDRLTLSAKDPQTEFSNAANKPLNTVELEIKKIWDKALNHNQFGIEDNFFEIGGDSIAAAVMISELEKKYHIDLPSEVFWYNPTVSGLSSTVISKSVSTNDPQNDTLQIDNDSIPDQKKKLLKNLVEVLKMPEGRIRLLEERKIRHMFRFFLQRFAQKYRKGVAFSYTINWLHIKLIKLILNRFKYPTVVKLLSKLIAKGFVPLLIQKKTRKAIIHFNNVINNKHVTKPVLHKSYLFYLLMECHVFNKAIETYRKGILPEIKLNIEGQHVLNKAIEKGKGVLLVGSHNSASRWLHCMELDVFTIGEIDSILTAYNLEAYKTSVYGSQLRAAMDRLKNGGIVRVVADGNQGSGVKHSYNVAGISKNLFTGFAELALQTDAVVVPITSNMPGPFEVNICFEEPFDTGKSNTEYQQRVQHLTNQYARMLEDHIVNFPWQVQIIQHFSDYELPHKVEKHI